MWTFVRLLILGAGVAMVVLSVRLWHDGQPPAWTLFAPHAETVVTLSEPRDEPAPDGVVRHRPHVEVIWPPGSTETVVLPGLVRVRDPFHLHTAEQIVREHPAGSRIAMRVIGGAPVADRTDLRDLGNALAASLGALVLTAGGLITLTGLPGQRRRNGDGTS